MSTAQDLQKQIADLLTTAGFSSQVLSVESCTRGKNNRTYRVESGDGLFIVKQYLRQAADTRDRLAAEFAFLSYAKEVAPGMTPQAYCQNKEQGLALYEFIEGELFDAQEVTAHEVGQAAEFFCALNEPSARAKALALPLASEACFSIQAHLDLIAARIAHLETLVPKSAEDEKAREVVAYLNHYWQGWTSKMTASAKADGFDLALPLEEHQRCISPSDFGFHNALLRPSGKLCFLDFEYAGWDDPAKMTGDFFSQLAVPVPAKLFHPFIQRVMTPFLGAESLRYRAELLRTVYRMKWCCIALNIFLPVHLARYRFANAALDVGAFKSGQLAKVATLIQSLES